MPTHSNSAFLIYKSMETKVKQERSEYLSIMVTSDFKKEFELLKGVPEMQEQILKHYLKNEVDFMQTEMKEIDNVTIKYKAKLIGIKENFEKAQSIYVDEIEKLYTQTGEMDSKISKSLNGSKSTLESLQYNLSSIKNELGKINSFDLHNITQKLESLMSIIDRYNKMSDTEKELIKLLSK